MVLRVYVGENAGHTLKDKLGCELIFAHQVLEAYVVLGRAAEEEKWLSSFGDSSVG